MHIQRVTYIDYILIYIFKIIIFVLRKWNYIKKLFHDASSNSFARILQITRVLNVNISNSSILESI